MTFNYLGYKGRNVKRVKRLQAVRLLANVNVMNMWEMNLRPLFLVLPEHVANKSKPFISLVLPPSQIMLLPTIGYYLTLTAPCVLAMLNLIWFSKITKGLIKTLTAKAD